MDANRMRTLTGLTRTLLTFGLLEGAGGFSAPSREPLP